MVKNAGSRHSPYLVELLSKRVELCKSMLANLQKKLNVLQEPLPAIHERLISILRTTSLANTKTKASSQGNSVMWCAPTPDLPRY